MTDRLRTNEAPLDPPTGESKGAMRDPLADLIIRHENVRFLTVTAVDDSGHITRLDPFIIRKCIEYNAGVVEYAKKLASGDLLVKVNTKEQVRALLNMTMMHDRKVNVIIPRNLNTCRGVISCRDLKEMEEDVIIAHMKDQDVVGVRIISRLDGNTRVNTNSMILTFGSARPPTHVYVGYERISVRPYVPLPMRCFKCQKFGHGSNRCRSTKVICGRCSGEHDGKDCKIEPKCVNCGGNHTSFDRSCDQYKLEAEIIAYKVKEDVSFPEARRHVMGTSGNTPAPNMSYASRVVAKPQTCDTGCQTDLTAEPLKTISFTISTATTGTSTSESHSSPPTSSSSESSTQPPPSSSSIVVESTQQHISKSIETGNMTKLTKVNIPHLPVPVAQVRNASREGAASLDRLAMETTTRGRALSPPQKGEPGHWSPTSKKSKQNNNRGTSSRKRYN